MIWEAHTMSHPALARFKLLEPPLKSFLKHKSASGLGGESVHFCATPLAVMHHGELRLA